jgi:hypothetical protein
MINEYRVSVKNPKGRDHSENLGIDKKIILEWILGKLRTGLIWARIGTSGWLL